MKVYPRLLAIVGGLVTLAAFVGGCNPSFPSSPPTSSVNASAVSVRLRSTAVTNTSKEWSFEVTTHRDFKTLKSLNFGWTLDLGPVGTVPHTYRIDCLVKKVDSKRLTTQLRVSEEGTASRSSITEYLTGLTPDAVLKGAKVPFHESTTTEKLPLNLITIHTGGSVKSLFQLAEAKSPGTSPKSK